MWQVFGSVILVCLTVVNCNKRIYQGVPDEFFMDCLTEINKYRKQHGALPLRWGTDLQYHAETWVDKLAAGGPLIRNDLEALDKLGQGQTVSYTSPPKKKCKTFPPSGDCYACRTTIASWYNESKYYDYNTGYSVERDRQVLHFTQLVWKGTVKVGMATAISPHYGVITVARFHPRGNIGYVDDYVRNVAPSGTPVENENNGFTTDGGQETRPHCRPRKRKRSKGCKNRYEDELCEFYAKRFDGYCEYNREFMKKYCAKTCHICNDRYPAPEVLETKDERKLNLRWESSDWFECHGGLQWRSVRCSHRFKDRIYQIQVKYCDRYLGEKPAEYRDCI